MGAQLTVLALLMCLCALLNQIGIVGASVPRSLAKRKVDPEWAYSAKDFYRRAWHTSIVVGNHLYIDGGEIYYLNNASSPKSLPLNSTYSIDLSVSWTNDSVVLNPIEKTSAPSLNVGNLFPDPSGTSFYQWNGKISSSIPYDQLPTPPRANLWQFRIDGDSGQWSLVNAPNLERLSRSASTQGNGTAYFLGGFGDWRTSTDYYSNANLRHSGGGLVSYEIQSQNWNNESIEEMAPTGWSFDAEFYYLEGLRREGLLLAMGGGTSPPGTSRTGDESLNPYSYVTLYDTAAKKWYNQSTSGDIPSRRYDPCTVGVPGDNGTFEIFMYGGSVIGTATYEEEQQSNIDLADVSILSVPSFRWYKTNLNPTSSRYRHSCEVVGQRQMVAIGGLTSGVTYANITKDPWAQGLGIFDLTDLEWRSSYDASAKAYQTPNLVKEDLAQNGQYPSTWDSNIVEGWFTNRAVDNEPSSGTGTPSPDSTSGKSSNTGAIVGGVIGGIGGLVLFGLAVFIFRRRSQRHQTNGTPLITSDELLQKCDKPLHTSDGLVHDQQQSELEGTRPNMSYAQVDSGELDSTHRFELPASEGQKSLGRQRG